MKKTARGIAEGVGSAIKRTARFKGIQSVIKVIKNKRALLSAPIAAVVTAIVLMSLTLNVSYAVAVSYNGETVGFVSSEEVCDAAVEKIANQMDSSAKKSLSKVDSKSSVTSGVTELLSADDLKDALVENMSDVEKAIGLLRNGELFAVLSEKADIGNALQNYLSENAGGLENARFKDDFKAESGYFTGDEIITESELLSLLRRSDIEVAATKTVVKTEKIAYDTVETESNKYEKGEKVTISAGKNGKQEVTSAVTVVNGKEVSAKVQKTIVVKEPVAKQVAVGTAKKSSRPLSLPLDPSSGYNITSNYGEYRGGYAHQGTDMVVNFGTDIMAAASGTVIEAGYSSYGWGNNVLIDHGNGIKTRYAHCSSLNVSVGEKVSRGEVIAKVGSTGDSECNHLHFEAYVNGVRTDAMQLVGK